MGTTLYEFLGTHREAILTRTRANVVARPAPRPTEDEIEGIPLFLDQITAKLRARPAASVAMAESAGRHGADLQRRGFTVAQVVHDYGGICQAVTELAAEENAPISADEFRVFNRCLDEAIAEAVTEFTHERERSQAAHEREHLGELAHELRNAVSAAIVSFEVLRTGKVGLEGNTAGVLSRSLRRLSALIDGSLTEVRLESGTTSLRRIPVRDLIEESAAAASMDAHARGLTLHVEPGEKGVEVQVDRPLFAAALSNLLQNAFKFTAPRSRVSLVVKATAEQVVIEVEDECGGLPPGKEAELFRPFEQHGADRSGLGLGLSIARKSVEANAGELGVRDKPGKGCVFSIALPRATG